MRIRNSLLVILLTTLIGTGLTSFKNNDCTQEGTILSFSSLKCGGCWGWIIKVGSDTIKTKNLPFTSITSNAIFRLKFPQKVKIGIEERKINPQSIYNKYHHVKCIEFVTDHKCSEIVWYRFLGGKPDMNYVQKSESVAKEWGFTIHYEFGSCVNTETDKRLHKECEVKNKKALNCLAERYGEDWQEEFLEQVENEK